MIRFPVFMVFMILRTGLLPAQVTKEAGKDDTVHLLETVTVEAYQLNGSLRTIPGSLSVLSGNNLRTGDGINPAATLNTIPGLQMQSGTLSTNRIVIRGMGSRTPYNSNRIRAYLNDIPLTSSDGISTPEDIDFRGLGRIEVIKGPGSALYGSGLGGSINLYTPQHTGQGFDAGLQYGSFGAWKTGMTGTLASDSAFVLGGLYQIRSGGYRENSRYRRTSMLATARVEKENGSIQATLLLIDVYGQIPSSLGRTQYENDPRSAAANWKAIGGYEQYRKGIMGITLTSKLSARIVNRLTLFGRWNDAFEKRPFNNLDDESLGGGIRNRLAFRYGKTDWVFGTEWIYEKYGWKLLDDSTLVNDNRESRRNANFFGMVYYRPLHSLNISAAVALNRVNYRLYDLYPLNGDQSGARKFPVILSPRLGINYAPVEQWAVYASAGRGFSHPSPEETLLPRGEVNPGIRPERGTQIEVGTRANLFGGNFMADIALYWIDLEDLLTTKRIAEDVFMGTNAGRSRHQGIEMRMESILLNRPAFPGALVAEMNYTLSINRFIDFTDDGVRYDGNHLPGIPDQILIIRMTWKPIKALCIMPDFQFTGKQYLNDGNSDTYPGYHLFNVKVVFTPGWMKKDGIQLFAGINNLTGTRYASMLVINAIATGSGEPRFFYPGMPRHGYAGLIFSMVKTGQ
jgi:iron complex outermembrane receptor protein